MSTTAHASSARSGDSEQSAPEPVCPRCKGLVYRIPRRFPDRVLSFFVPVQRYRCRSWACRWEGNLRLTEDSLPVGRRGKVYEGRSRPLEPSRMSPTVPAEKLPQSAVEAIEGKRRL